jgi:hypothetical protein
VDWIHLAQDRYWWRAVINTVMKLRVNEQMQFLDWLSVLLKLCSMELFLRGM